jgi:hypothetical protein
LFTAGSAARVEALAAEIARTIPAEFVMVGLIEGRRCLSPISRAR